MNSRGSIIWVAVSIVAIIVGIGLIMERAGFADSPTTTLNETDSTNTPTPSEQAIGGFCGSATFDTCTTDADCAPAGCSGQICAGVDGEELFSTCEWLECYDSAAYGVGCGCFEGQCQWSQQGIITDITPIRSDVVFTTDDGKRIVGNHYDTQSREQGVLALHMLGSSRGSYDSLISALNAEGIGVVAIDFRGHGLSEEGPQGYTTYSNAQIQAMIHDVQVGVAYLNEQGYSSLTIIGASIGANLALQYAAQYQGIDRLVLLSPGLNYRGILAEQYAEALPATTSVFTLVASGDGSLEDDAATIHAKVNGERQFRITSIGHGTDMFIHQPGLESEIIRWLDN